MSDIFLSIIFLIILLPVILIAVILIALDGTSGSIIIKNPRRVGKSGVQFDMYKFRTMIPDAHEVLKKDPKMKVLKKRQSKGGKLGIHEDVRITSAGKFLRKWDIDEIPQLINVIKGEMSLVGPRPYLKEELDVCQEKYPQTKEFIKTLLSVKPGITGLWQVSGRNDIKLVDRIKMDANYAKDKGLLNDLIIIIKTPFVVISHKGAR